MESPFGAGSKSLGELAEWQLNATRVAELTVQTGREMKKQQTAMVDEHHRREAKRSLSEPLRIAAEELPTTCRKSASWRWTEAASARASKTGLAVSPIITGGNFKRAASCVCRATNRATIHVLVCRDFSWTDPRCRSS